MWLVILITSLTFRINYYTQVSRLLKAFTNNSSGNIKLSKTHLYEIGESGGFSGRRNCAKIELVKKFAKMFHKKELQKTISKRAQCWKCNQKKR